MKRSSLGFSLVEMITVIIVLAIVMTTGFFFYKDYAVSARNGARVKELNNMAVSLENYKAKT